MTKPDAPSVRPETTPLQRYQIVTLNGSDLATTPPLDVRAVSIWPAAHGGWIRFRDYEAERAELVAALRNLLELVELRAPESSRWPDCETARDLLARIMGASS